MSLCCSHSPSRRGERARTVRIGELAVVSLFCLGLSAQGALAASITLYSAQHEQTVDLLTKAFTK